MVLSLHVGSCTWGLGPVFWIISLYIFLGVHLLGEGLQGLEVGGLQGLEVGGVLNNGRERELGYQAFDRAMTVGKSEPNPRRKRASCLSLHIVIGANPPPRTEKEGRDHGPHGHCSQEGLS